MTTAECVILTLVWMGKRFQAVKFTVGAELVTPSGENLVSVSLMSYVPHDTVVWCVKHIVQSYRKFHNSKA